jgi:hypothetical protein
MPEYYVTYNYHKEDGTIEPMRLDVYDEKGALWLANMLKSDENITDIQTMTYDWINKEERVIA